MPLTGEYQTLLLRYITLSHFFLSVNKLSFSLQVSWNIYLTSVKQEDCVVYDRQWTKEIATTCSYPFPLYLIDGRRAKVFI